MADDDDIRGGNGSGSIPNQQVETNSSDFLSSTECEHVLKTISKNKCMNDMGLKSVSLNCIQPLNAFRKGLTVYIANNRCNLCLQFSVISKDDSSIICQTKEVVGNVSPMFNEVLTQ